MHVAFFVQFFRIHTSQVPPIKQILGTAVGLFLRLPHGVEFLEGGFARVKSFAITIVQTPHSEIKFRQLWIELYSF